MVGAMFILAPLLLCTVKEVHAKDTYLIEMDKLDDLRLTDFKTFQHELAALGELSNDFSSEEMDYFTLLKASESTLLSEFDRSTELLEARVRVIGTDAIRIRALALLVNSYALAQDYAKAFEYFELLIDDRSQITNEKALVQRLGVIALLYIKLGKFELAQFYLENIDTLPISESNLCRLYTQKVEAISVSATPNDFDQVSQFGFNLCIKNNETIAAGFIVAEIIRFKLSQHQYDEATRVYQLFRDKLYSTNYPFLIAKANALVSRAYFHENNLNQAELLAKEALEFAGERQVGLPVIEASHSLYEIAKSSRRHKEALDYLELFQKTQKQYSEDLHAQLLAYNLAQGEIEVKNQRIALLDKDNEVLSLQKDLYEQEAKQNRLIMLVLASVLALATVLAYRGMTGRKRFKKIAEYDQLTGISNRYHFNNQAKITLDYCDKNAKPASVILFDLDHFKNINDSYGHSIGDWALQAVVKTCRNFMRNNDIFGRIGGEEFAVVLPGCQLDKAVLLAEICRDAIAAIDSIDSGIKFPLSASFGVSGSDTSGYQLKQLLADADHAMYRAKEAGRDQVAQYRPASPAV